MIINNDDKTGSTGTTAFSVTNTNNVTSVRVSGDSAYVAVGNANGVVDIYSRYCGVCPIGTYLNYTSFFFNASITNRNPCRMCSLDILGCAICSNSTLCFGCNIGYYLNQTLCYSCS
jgi:hypothetical protein